MEANEGKWDIPTKQPDAAFSDCTYTQERFGCSSAHGHALSSPPSALRHASVQQGFPPMTLLP